MDNLNNINESNPEDGYTLLDDSRQNFKSKLLSGTEDEFEEQDITDTKNNILTKEESSEPDKTENTDSEELQLKSKSSYEDDFIALNSVDIKDLKEKSIVPGKVVLVTSEYVMIDIGAKSEGMIDISEFIQIPSPNDEIQVYIDKLESSDGIKLSYRTAYNIIKQEEIIYAYQNNVPITGKVKNIVKGGFIIDIGIDAFCHISELSESFISKPEIYLDKQYEFKIIQCDDKMRNVKVSRLQLIKEQREIRYREFLVNHKEGDIVSAKISKILKNLIISEVEGIKGLIFIQDLSWGYVDDINTLYKPGQIIDSKILEFNEKDFSVKLGIKQLKNDPWSTIEKEYKTGDIVYGTVFRIDSKNGIQLNITDGIIGFLPKSELSWTSSNSIYDFKPGDSVSVKIIEINPEQKSMILSLKKKEISPWDVVSQYKIKNQPVEAVITEIKDNVLIVELFNGLRGFIPKKFTAWENVDLNRDFHEGQSISCKILELNEKDGKIMLSRKAVLTDPWYEKVKKTGVRKPVECTVEKVLKTGVIVKFDESLTGFITTKEISRKFIKQPDEIVKEGDTLKAMIKDINYNSKRISLSVVDYEYYLEKSELKSYLNSQEDVSNQLGDFFNNDLLKKFEGN